MTEEILKALAVGLYAHGSICLALFDQAVRTARLENFAVKKITPVFTEVIFILQKVGASDMQLAPTWWT